MSNVSVSQQCSRESTRVRTTTRRPRASYQYTQEDPIGAAGGLNLYGYAGGDPLNYSDPYGLDCYGPDGRRIPCSAAGVVVGGAVGAAAGVFATGACASVTFGICAAGGPAIVGLGTLGGVAVGALIGELSDGSEALVSLAKKAGGMGAAMLATSVLALHATLAAGFPPPPCRPPRDTPDAKQSTTSTGTAAGTEMPSPRTVDSTKVVTEDKDPCNPAAR